MLMTLDTAKAAIAYYKEEQPDQYKALGGEKITDEIISEALEIVDAIVGAVPNKSEDELFKQELTRITNSK